MAMLMGTIHSTKKMQMVSPIWLLGIVFFISSHTFFFCSTINPNITSYTYFLIARSSRTKKTPDCYRERNPLKML